MADSQHPLSIISLRTTSPVKSPHSPASYTLINDSKSCRLLHLATSKVVHSGNEEMSTPILIQSFTPSHKTGQGRGLEGRGRRRGSPGMEWKSSGQKLELRSALSALRVTKASTCLAPIHTKRPRSRHLLKPQHPLLSLLLVSAAPHPAYKPAYPGQLTGWDS